MASSKKQTTQYRSRNSQESQSSSSEFRDLRDLLNSRRKGREISTKDDERKFRYSEKTLNMDESTEDIRQIFRKRNNSRENFKTSPSYDENSRNSSSDFGRFQPSRNSSRNSSRDEAQTFRDSRRFSRENPQRKYENPPRFSSSKSSRNYEIKDKPEILEKLRDRKPIRMRNAASCLSDLVKHQIVKAVESNIKKEAKISASSSESIVEVLSSSEENKNAKDSLSDSNSTTQSIEEILKSCGKEKNTVSWLELMDGNEDAEEEEKASKNDPEKSEIVKASEKSPGEVVSRIIEISNEPEKLKTSEQNISQIHEQKTSKTPEQKTSKTPDFSPENSQNQMKLEIKIKHKKVFSAVYESTSATQSQKDFLQNLSKSSSSESLNDKSRSSSRESTKSHSSVQSRLNKFRGSPNHPQEHPRTVEASNFLSRPQNSDFFARPQSGNTLNPNSKSFEISKQNFRNFSTQQNFASNSRSFQNPNFGQNFRNVRHNFQNSDQVHRNFRPNIDRHPRNSNLRSSFQNLRNSNQNLRSLNQNWRNSNQNLHEYHYSNPNGKGFANLTHNNQEFSSISRKHPTEVPISRSNSVPNLQLPDQNAFEASIQNLADIAFNYQPINQQLSESLTFQASPNENFAHFYNQPPPPALTQQQPHRGLTADQFNTLDYILRSSPKYLNETLNYFLDYYPEIGQNLDRDAVNFVLALRGIMLQ